MYKKVKNISDQLLSIPDVGVVEAGATITVPVDFNNPNFEVVEFETSTEKANAPTKKGDKNINN